MLEDGLIYRGYLGLDEKKAEKKGKQPPALYKNTRLK